MASLFKLNNMSIDDLSDPWYNGVRPRYGVYKFNLFHTANQNRK